MATDEKTKMASSDAGFMRPATGDLGFTPHDGSAFCGTRRSAEQPLDASGSRDRTTTCIDAA
jgi:hypothetical protein